jgi:alkylated DNA repair dioxygenase AlkB
MNLFQNQNQNILPYDGEVIYLRNCLSNEESKIYIEYLYNQIEWQHDEVILFGKKIQTKRKVAWYADKAIEYKYSNSIKIAKLWTDKLIDLKSKVEELTNEKYNACLLNLYNNGLESMSWHSDNEKTIVENSTIASLTLGAERKFEFKHKKTNEKVSLVLENSSILLMKKNTQANWLHSLPKTTKIKNARINLTFRQMIS